MGTFLFTNILLLKEKKHGRAKSCSPMPKGSRHSSQRVPTLSGKYVSFSSTLHSCLPSLPTAPFFFIFSLIQSSHPRKGGLTLAWRALSVFHTTLVSHSINASSIVTLHIRTQIPTRSGELSRVVACVVISVNI